MGTGWDVCQYAIGAQSGEFEWLREGPRGDTETKAETKTKTEYMYTRRMKNIRADVQSAWQGCTLSDAAREHAHCFFELESRAESRQ